MSFLLRVFSGAGARSAGAATGLGYGDTVDIVQEAFRVWNIDIVVKINQHCACNMKLVSCSDDAERLRCELQAHEWASGRSNQLMTVLWRRWFNTREVLPQREVTVRSSTKEWPPGHVKCPYIIPSKPTRYIALWCMREHKITHYLFARRLKFRVKLIRPSKLKDLALVALN